MESIIESGILWNGKWNGKKLRFQSGMEPEWNGNGMESGMENIHLS